MGSQKKKSLLAKAVKKTKAEKLKKEELTDAQATQMEASLQFDMLMRLKAEELLRLEEQQASEALGIKSTGTNTASGRKRGSLNLAKIGGTLKLDSGQPPEDFSLSSLSTSPQPTTDVEGK